MKDRVDFPAVLLLSLGRFTCACVQRDFLLIRPSRDPAPLLSPLAQQPPQLPRAVSVP